MPAATPRTITKIVSGGQTGADRAALDEAIRAGVDVGGWVPGGRLAEDGIVPHTYPNLEETLTEVPEERTRLNAALSDGTVIVVRGPLRGGTAYTASVAGELGKPLLILDFARLAMDEAAGALRDWLAEHRIAVLNVAGPRASEDSGIYALTRTLLSKVL